MNKNDFHVPFIQSLIIVAIVTVFAMIGSHYLVDYYYGGDHFQFSSSKYQPDESTSEVK